MSHYHLHEGVLSVPEGWRDQSMNVFRLPGSNSNKDAAIILTRDYETTLGSPGEYASAQQEAAKKSFPGYKQISSSDLEVDGCPASVVDYQWRSNGSALLRQRQLYVRHQTAMLTLTASAMASEFERIDDVWQELLSSFRLFEREKEATEAEAPADAEQLPHVFALSARDRQLHVFENPEQACRRTDPLEVESDAWVFFQSDGAPLKPVFVKPNRRSMLRVERGFYELVLDVVGVSLPLQKRLAGVSGLVAAPPFDTLEVLRNHLESVATSSRQSG